LQRSHKIALRIAIALFAYSFIAIKVGWNGRGDISNILEESLSSQNLCWVILTIALMPIVWALEAIKWRFILSDYTPISFWRSWRSVWYGVVAGHLTPNRIGEPIGRLALIEPEARGKAGFLAIWCSFTQQMATLLFGLIGIVWWLGAKGFNLLPSSIPNWLIVAVVLLWIIFLLFGIFKINWLSRWFEHFQWFQRLLNSEKLNLRIKLSTYLLVQLISILRYAIFSTQYVILLRLFGVAANPIDLYAIVALTYFFTSLIPTFSASEIGVKAGFAIWFAAMVSDNALGVTAASLFLWILNLAIPALIAAWFPWKGEE